jgi:DNA-binding NarL/FixJ family response regulator
MIRVVIADDQELVREGFRMIIDREDDLEVVGQAADGQAAIELARSAGPDVVLMDLRMPRMDGLEATRRILAAPGPPRILVLTTFDRNDYLYAAMKAGASGFLLKDVRRGQLTEAIRTVATGEALLAPAITRRLIEDFVRLPPPGGRVPDRFKDLTEREAGVLRLVAYGLSNTEIAAELFVAETTVKTHVGRILAKLALRDRVQAVVIAYETGLIRPGDRLRPLKFPAASSTDESA